MLGGNNKTKRNQREYERKKPARQSAVPLIIVFTNQTFLIGSNLSYVSSNWVGVIFLNRYIRVSNPDNFYFTAIYHLL